MLNLGSEPEHVQRGVDLKARQAQVWMLDGDVSTESAGSVMAEAVLLLSSRPSRQFAYRLGRNVSGLTEEDGETAGRTQVGKSCRHVVHDIENLGLPEVARVWRSCQYAEG